MSNPELFPFNKTSHYLRVLNFMELAGQTVRKKPALPTREERKLRARLILEEAMETVEALGFKVFHSPAVPDPEVKMEHLNFCDEGNPNLVEIADGCADIFVVTTGTLIACGMPDMELLRMVDENNEKKFGPGSFKDANGKHCKPPGHPKPPIEEWLKSL